MGIIPKNDYFKFSTKGLHFEFRKPNPQNNPAANPSRPQAPAQPPTQQLGGHRPTAQSLANTHGPSSYDPNIHGMPQAHGQRRMPGSYPPHPPAQGQVFPQQQRQIFQQPHPQQHGQIFHQQPPQQHGQLFHQQPPQQRQAFHQYPQQQGQGFQQQMQAFHHSQALPPRPATPQSPSRFPSVQLTGPSVLTAAFTPPDSPRMSHPSPPSPIHPPANHLAPASPGRSPEQMAQLANQRSYQEQMRQNSQDAVPSLSNQHRDSGHQGYTVGRDGRFQEGAKGADPKDHLDAHPGYSVGRDGRIQEGLKGADPKDHLDAHPGYSVGRDGRIQEGLKGADPKDHLDAPELQGTAPKSPKAGAPKSPVLEETKQRFAEDKAKGIPSGTVTTETIQSGDKTIKRTSTSYDQTWKDSQGITYLGGM